MAIVFNRAVQRDVNQILEYYRREAGDVLADAFFEELLAAIDDAHEHPERHHYAVQPLRRVNLKRFPYNFIFREIGSDIRVLVVRHHKRHPSFGLRRR